MLVIGLAGYAASGKTEVVNYLKQKFSFTVLEFSDVIEEEARRLGLIKEELSLEEKKRKLSEVGETIRYYYKNETIFAELLVKKIFEKNLKRVAVPGFRSVYEVQTFRENFGNNFYLIWIETDAKIRYERRKLQDPNFNLSFEEFLERDKRDEALLGISKLKSLSDFVIENNSSLEDLKRKVDSILSFLLK